MVQLLVTRNKSCLPAPLWRRSRSHSRRNAASSLAGVRTCRLGRGSQAAISPCKRGFSMMVIASRRDGRVDRPPRSGSVPPPSSSRMAAACRRRSARPAVGPRAGRPGRAGFGPAVLAAAPGEPPLSNGWSLATSLLRRHPRAGNRACPAATTQGRRPRQAGADGRPRPAWQLTYAHRTDRRSEFSPRPPLAAPGPPHAGPSAPVRRITRSPSACTLNGQGRPRWPVRSERSPGHAVAGRVQGVGRHAFLPGPQHVQGTP